MAEQQALPGLLKPTREERVELIDSEILDIEGAARMLGVSTRTIYNLARKGEIPAMKVGREWRFARRNIVNWVANGTEADQLAAARRKSRVSKRRK